MKHTLLIFIYMFEKKIKCRNKWVKNGVEKILDIFTQFVYIPAV